MGKQSQITDLSKLDPNKLPEIQGFKETQLKLVEENPYVVIEDNSTYEEAKKHRTALRTGRTTLEKQEKLVTKKLNEFKNKVKETTAELIKITLPHEEKQQAEVSRYEEIKEQERLERERIEEERIQGHKENIAKFKSDWENRIELLVYENSLSLQSEFIKEIANTDLESFEEFDIEMQTIVALVEDKLNSKLKFLNLQEEQRQESLRLQKERQEQERIQKIKDIIENYFYYWSNEIGEIDIQTDLNKFYKTMSEAKLERLDEFEELYKEKRAKLTTLFESRSKLIEQEVAQEKQRLDLEKERQQIETEKRENIYIKRVNELEKINYFNHYRQEEGFKDEILAMPDEVFEVFVKESHDSILKSMEAKSILDNIANSEDFKNLKEGSDIDLIEGNKVYFKNNTNGSFSDEEIKNIKANYEELEVKEDNQSLVKGDVAQSESQKLISYLENYLTFNFDFEDNDEDLNTIYQDFLKKFESLKQKTIKQIQKYEQTHN